MLWFCLRCCCIGFVFGGVVLGCVCCFVVVLFLFCVVGVGSGFDFDCISFSVCLFVPTHGARHARAPHHPTLKRGTLYVFSRFKITPLIFSGRKFCNRDFVYILSHF